MRLTRHLLLAAWHVAVVDRKERWFGEERDVGRYEALVGACGLVNLERGSQEIVEESDSMADL